jgi:hypothetical protein
MASTALQFFDIVTRFPYLFFPKHGLADWWYGGTVTMNFLTLCAILLLW